MIMQGVRKKKTILFISYYRQLKSYKIHFLLIKFDGGLNKYEVCNYYIRFDHFLLPMQCTGNLDCFWWGKRAAIIRRYPAVFVVCFAFYSLCAMFSWLRTISFETYSFKTDGFGIFTIRKHLGAFRTHEVGEGRGVKHKHVCTRADAEGEKRCRLPCPARGSKPLSYVRPPSGKQQHRHQAKIVYTFLSTSCFEVSIC